MLVEQQQWGWAVKKEIMKYNIKYTHADTFMGCNTVTWIDTDDFI